jgi:hypothetical protein
MNSETIEFKDTDDFQAALLKLLHAAEKGSIRNSQHEFNQ